MLPHRAIWIRRPTDFIDGIAIRQRHAAIFKLAIQHQDIARAINPRLVPDFTARVINVKTLADKIPLSFP